MPDRTVADFYIRYPDEVYLAQVVEFVDNAAKAAALATGTKVKIDHYSRLVDGVSLATLGDLGFAYMKSFGATGVSETPGKPQGFEETGSVSRDSGYRHHCTVVNVLQYLRDGCRQPEEIVQGLHRRRAGDDGRAVRLRHACGLSPRSKEFDGIKALFGERAR